MKSLRLLILAFLLAGASPFLHADPAAFRNPFNLLDQGPLLGDCYGCRPMAETNGVVLSVESISDMLGNTTGGISRGGDYSGALNLGLAADLGKSAGLEGTSFKTTWLWLYGNDVSSSHVGNAMTVSSIYGLPAFRCYELWLQQNLFKDAVSLRAGLLGLDTEFAVSDTASFFVNSTFGIPAGITMNLPNGGPTYPEATPAVRLALQPASWLVLRSALAQGNSFPQDENLHNFNWDFGPSAGLLSLNEAAASWNQDPSSKDLPGTVKAGFWIQTGNASPGEIQFGSPTLASYSDGFYGIVDQHLYTPRGDASASGKAVTAPDGKQAADSASVKGLSAFGRVCFSPQSWSPCSLYTDGGLAYTGLIPGRDQDKLGMAFAYAGMGGQCASATAASGCPGASFEAVAELTYSIRVAPAIALQPDFQYILQPGGGRQYGNALVVGMRAVVDF